MAQQGTTTIDFGIFPGKSDASIAVTGQSGIIAGSLVEAWIRPVATGDHSIDEHLADPPRVIAGNIVAGTGFTIYGFIDGFQQITRLPGAPEGGLNNSSPLCYGQWTVAWVWN